MKNTLRLLVSTLVLLSFVATASAQTLSRVATFASTDSPESIAVDAAGNCYLSSLSSVWPKTPLFSAVRALGAIGWASPARFFAGKHDVAALFRTKSPAATIPHPSCPVS